jgi:hypothetical protein
MLDEKESLSKDELESAKVLAASLQFTRNEVKKVKTDLIEGFKEITDPATGEKVKVLEIVGRKGLKGERGEDGKHGPIGSMGPRGPEGVPGKMGPQGIQGPIGLTGSQGPEGLTGPAGIDGDDADVSEVSSQVARLKTRLNLLASSTGHLSTHTGWGEYVGGGGGAQPDGENLGNPSTSEYRPFSTLKSGANSTLQFYKAIGNNGIQFVRNSANTGYYAQIDSSATINVSSFNITSTSASLNVAGLTSLANTVPKANVTYDLGSPQLYWKNVYAQAIVTTGDLQLGDDSTDTVTIGADIGSDIIPNTDSTYDLGNTTHRWANIYVDDIAVTSLSGAGLTANSTEVDITTTTLDVNANLAVHSTLLANSTNVTLAGTSATFSANVTTTAANVYINGTDLLVSSNTRITTTTLDVNANLAVHSTLLANSTNVTLAGTSGTISSNATFSANVTTTGANVYINGTDLLVSSNTRLPSFTANTTEVDITTTTLDVNANLAVHDTLSANSTNVTLAGTSGTISSNATFTANLTTTGANVYINGTDLKVTSNTTLPSFTANTTEVDITTTTFDVNANLAVHSTLTANSTNVTLAGTSGTISSNATFAANLTTTGANVYINGTDLKVDSNSTFSGANVYINTTDLLVKANTRQTANVTFSGANVVLTSHVSGSGIEERIQDVTAAMLRNTADPSSTYAGTMVGLKIIYDDTNGELDITNEIATHPFTEAGHAHPQIANFGLVTEDLVSGIQMLEFLQGVTSRAFDLGVITASSSVDISNGLLP